MALCWKLYYMRTFSYNTAHIRWLSFYHYWLIHVIKQGFALVQTHILSMNVFMHYIRSLQTGRIEDVYVWWRHTTFTKSKGILVRTKPSIKFINETIFELQRLTRFSDFDLWWHLLTYVDPWHCQAQIDVLIFRQNLIYFSFQKSDQQWVATTL